MKSRRTRRHSIASLAAALVFSALSPVHAAARLDAAFVELLSRAGRRHPLADASGKLPVVVELPPFVDARALGFEPLGPGLATLRIAPAELAAFESRHPDLPFSIWPSFHPILDQSAKLNGTLTYRSALRASGSPIAGTGKGVVVGIVDSGLDVTHPDFVDESGHSRVAWMLDFSHPPLGLHADVETDFGCTDPMQAPCAVLDRDDIDAARGGTVGAYLPRDELGHGTHVTSIAAGNGGGGANARFIGGAPEATLVVVNVTHGPGGESSDVDIAAGVRFIFDRAGALGAPAVANLSLGSDFGPHDGTTPLEKSLGSMVGPDRPGRAIVVAGGNSGVLYQGDQPTQRLGVHSQTRITAGVPARMVLKSLSDFGADELSGTVSIWMTFGANDDISVALDGPSGLSIAPVGHGAKAGGSTPDHELTGAIYNGVVDPDVTLTADTRGAIAFWTGAWPAAAEMSLRFEGEGFVDAWVESSPDGTSSDFVEFFEVATREGTINVPATSPDVIAVGCTVNRTEWTDADLHDHETTDSQVLGLFSPADATCYFSSAGPTATGIAKPELSAPGAMVIGAMSADAVPGQGHASLFDPTPGTCPDGNECLVVDPKHAILSGSSMSSPQVSGAIALLFERDATLTQPDVLMLLEQGARRPKGTIGADYQLGVGALAIDGAMAAFDARSSAIVREPDPEQSWMSLSTDYVPPDLDHGVAGTVEMRAADGTLADGFDAGRLSLDVSSEGTVTSSIARVGPGLFRFEVRARPGTGSRAIDVDVRLDGVTIGDSQSPLSGHRAIPIGADRWIAFGSGRAYGGCAIVSRRDRGAIGITPLLAVLVLRRKKSRRHHGDGATVST